MTENIEINGHSLHAGCGQPTLYHWPRQEPDGQVDALARIYLSFITSSAEATDTVENLLKQDFVMVKDPFAGRTYRATLNKVFDSPASPATADHRKRRYFIDVCEALPA